VSRSIIRYRHGTIDLRDFVERLIDGDEPEPLIVAKWSRVHEVDNVIRHKPHREAPAIPFHKPIRRAYRLSTSDGRTSFHFSQKIVVQKAESLMIGNVQIQAGAASEHCRYIEREGAVAAVSTPEHASAYPVSNGTQNDAARVGYQENDDDLRPYVGHYLGIRPGAGQQESQDLRSAVFRVDQEGAARDGLFALPGSDVATLGWRTDLILRDHATRRVDEAEPHSPGSMRGEVGGTGALGDRAEPKGRGRGARSIAADHRSYLERPDALARQPDGTLALITNIADEPDVRQRFWRAVEENESKRGSDRMSLDISRAPGFWSRVAADEHCPAELRDALLSKDDADRQRFEIPSGKAMRSFLQSVPGWVGKRKRQSGESSADYARSSEPLAKFHDGRGGRIQQRIIIELPSESSMAARMRMLKRFCHEFERRRLPFNAVIHAPDHGSDERQWHAHLDYYHRPVRVVTKADADNAKARGLVPDGDVVGQWDFEARFFEGKRRDRSRRPFRQDTVEEVRDEGWIPHLRSRLAFIVNDELRAEGQYPRYDPRSYDEMGIKADPAEHLGVKLNAAEGKGEVSAIGVLNEQKQWVAIEEALETKLTEARASIYDAADVRCKRLAVLEISRDHAAAIESGIESIIQWSVRAADAAYEAAMAHELAARACSRANHVHDKSDRLLRASDAGKLNLSAKERDQRLTLLEASATFLDRLQPFREAVRGTVQRCDEERAEAAKMARAAERIVEGLLSNAEAKARRVDTIPGAASPAVAGREGAEAAPPSVVIATNGRERADWLDRLRRLRPIVQKSSEGFGLARAGGGVGLEQKDAQEVLSNLFVAQEREVDELTRDPTFRRALNRRADGWHLYGRGPEAARRFLVLRDHPRLSSEIARLVAHPGAAARQSLDRSSATELKRVTSGETFSQPTAARSAEAAASLNTPKHIQSGDAAARPHEPVSGSRRDITDGQHNGESSLVPRGREPVRTSIHQIINNGVTLVIGTDGKIDMVALRKQGVLIDENDRSDARLIGRAKAQADYARRAVVNFIKKEPGFIIEHEGRYLLSPKTKADIAALARDFDSPAMQIVLRLAWAEHRAKADRQRLDETVSRTPQYTAVVRDEEAIAAAKAYHAEQRRLGRSVTVEPTPAVEAGKPMAPPSGSPERSRQPPPGWDRGGQGR